MFAISSVLNRTQIFRQKFWFCKNEWGNLMQLGMFPVDLIDYWVFNTYLVFTFNQDFRQLKWWLMGMIMGPLIVFGFCGNLMSITVLLRRKMRCEAFNQLLASLCVIDTIFILCNSMSCAYALRINSRKYGDFFVVR